MKSLKQVVAVVLVLFAWSATVAAARTAILVDHESIPVTAKSAADVKRAILVAAASRGWAVLKQTDNNIRLQYDKGGKHQVVIDVRYDTKSYGIKYVDSTNLHYSERDGRRVIHRNYNRWIDYLINSIRVELLKVS